MPAKLGSIKQRVGFKQFHLGDLPLRSEWDSLQVYGVNIQKGKENCQLIFDLPVKTADFQ